MIEPSLLCAIILYYLTRKWIKGMESRVWVLFIKRSPPCPKVEYKCQTYDPQPSAPRFSKHEETERLLKLMMVK